MRNIITARRKKRKGPEKDYNEYAVCTESVGSTAGTTERSEWDSDDKERYDRCLDHVRNDD